MPSPHNEYPSNGQRRMQYHPEGGSALKDSEPSYDGTEERTVNNLEYMQYNDTGVANPDGQGEQNDHNVYYSKYSDSDKVANPESYEFDNDQYVEHETEEDNA